MPEVVATCTASSLQEYPAIFKKSFQVIQSALTLNLRGKDGISLTESNHLDKQVIEIRNLWNDSDTFKVGEIISLAKRIKKCFDCGGTLAFAGNGGSAAEANHLAAEFVGRCVVDHIPMKSLSFSSNNSVITAIVNDYGAEKIFSRQAEAFLNSDSILIGLSTSGKSRNVLEGLKTAKDIGAHTVFWTSKLQTEKLNFIDEVWKVDSSITPQIGRAHV